MSNSARKTSTVGEIVSLMSVDCQRIQDAFTFSQFLVSLPFITAGKIFKLMLLYFSTSDGNKKLGYSVCKVMQ